MAAPSSIILAEVLRQGGLIELSKRALADEFHDYLSPHAMPAVTLVKELHEASTDPRRHERSRIAAHNIRQRVAEGEFDATEEEADRWAESAEGRRTLGSLSKG